MQTQQLETFNQRILELEGLLRIGSEDALQQAEKGIEAFERDHPNTAPLFNLKGLLCVQKGEIPQAAGQEYERWRQGLTQDPNVMGGSTVFPGSRLTVSRIGHILLRGEKPERIRKDYPFLAEQDMSYAIQYVLEDGERSRGSA